MHINHHTLPRLLHLHLLWLAAAAAAAGGNWVKPSELRTERQGDQALLLELIPTRTRLLLLLLSRNPGCAWRDEELSSTLSLKEGRRRLVQLHFPEEPQPVVTQRPPHHSGLESSSLCPLLACCAHHRWSDSWFPPHPPPSPRHFPSCLCNRLYIRAHRPIRDTAVHTTAGCLAGNRLLRDNVLAIFFERLKNND